MKNLMLAALLVVAAPAFAQVSLEPDASVGYCEGCQSGNLVLVMDGGQAYAFGLKFDAAEGVWTGNGSVSYNRLGVVASGPAQFRVGFKKAADLGVVPCSQAGRSIDTFVASVDILSENVRFQSVGAPVFDLSGSCPSEKIAVSVSVVKRGFGKVKKEFSWGEVKDSYARTVSGRIYRKG